MVSWILYTGAAVACLAIGLVAAGQAGALGGRRPADLGVHDGRLKPPAATPNCVSSQAALYDTDGARYARIEALRFDGDGDAAFERLKQLVSSAPGSRVIEARPGYLYAEFTTPLLHFVDDVEFYLPPGARQIELRSASRLGHSDLGTNRKRIERIRASFAASH
jgi:uncharacterized protein (DUF1499 family)